MSKIKSGSLSESVSESVTRSPIELFWTAQKQLMWPKSHSKNTKVGRLSQIFRTFVLKFGGGEVEGGRGVKPILAMSRFTNRPFLK